MSSKVSHQIKHRETPKDVFYTPESVVEKHISLIESSADDVWYDPFYGQGAYYHKFPNPETAKWSEIELHKDFFQFDEPVDVICSNPPYSLLDKVFEKSIQLKPRVISYLLLHGSLTPKRMEIMQNAGYGLTAIYTCKVYQWYGMAEAYVFERGKDWNNCKIVYDRIVHRV